MITRFISNNSGLERFLLTLDTESKTYRMDTITNSYVQIAKTCTVVSLDTIRAIFSVAKSAGMTRTTA